MKRLFSRKTLQRDWRGNVRGDVLAGLIVVLALIPEAIAFSIIAGWARVGKVMAFDDSPGSCKAVAYVVASRTGLPTEAALERAREQLATAGYAVSAQIKPGSAGKVIAQEMKQAGVDLLVMGAWGTRSSVSSSSAAPRRRWPAPARYLC